MTQNQKHISTIKMRVNTDIYLNIYRCIIDKTKDLKDYSYQKKQKDKDVEDKNKKNTTMKNRSTPPFTMQRAVIES